MDFWRGAWHSRTATPAFIIHCLEGNKTIGKRDIISIINIFKDLVRLVNRLPSDNLFLK